MFENIMFGLFWLAIAFLLVSLFYLLTTGDLPWWLFKKSRAMNTLFKALEQRPSKDLFTVLEELEVRLVPMRALSLI